MDYEAPGSEMRNVKAADSSIQYDVISLHDSQFSIYEICVCVVKAVVMMSSSEIEKKIEAVREFWEEFAPTFSAWERMTVQAAMGLQQHMQLDSASNVIECGAGLGTASIGILEKVGDVSWTYEHRDGDMGGMEMDRTCRYMYGLRWGEGGSNKEWPIGGWDEVLVIVVMVSTCC